VPSELNVSVAVIQVVMPGSMELIAVSSVAVDERSFCQEKSLSRSTFAWRMRLQVAATKVAMSHERQWYCRLPTSPCPPTPSAPSVWLPGTRRRTVEHSGRRVLAAVFGGSCEAGKRSTSPDSRANAAPDNNRSCASCSADLRLPGPRGAVWIPSMPNWIASR